MTATAFDTLKAAKALEDAGFDETQAEAVVATVDEAIREYTAPLASGIATIAKQTATRESVSTLTTKVETIVDTMATKEDVASATRNMATEEHVASATKGMATREHVAAEIAGLRAEMAVEFKTLYRHLWVVGTSFVGVTVALIKLLP